MRKIILFLVISFVILNSSFVITNAQLHGQARIDSLLKELHKMKNDTNAVNLLADLSFHYYSINPDEGIRIGEKGLKITEKISWKEGEANIYHSLGTNFAGGKSDFSRALEYYHKSLELYEKLGINSGIAKNLGNIGIIYSRQSEYSIALEYYHKARKAEEELGNKSGIAKNLGNIAVLYNRQSDYTKALEYFEKALEIYEELCDKSGIVKNVEQIAFIYYQYKSDNSKSLEYYLRALKINKEFANKSRIAGNLSQIGLIYDRQSDYTNSLESTLKALKIYEEIGDMSGIANSYGNIGVIYNNIADYPKALDYHQRALKINEELGRKSNIANNLQNIGLNYTYQFDYVKALEYFQKALKINEELGNKSRIAYNLGNIAGVHQEQSDYHKAIEYYFNSLKIFEELKLKRGIALRYGTLGLLYYKLSHDSTLSKIKEATEFISLDKSLNLNRAIEYLIESIKIHNDLDELIDRSSFYKILADAYAEKGDYKNAFEAFQEYITLKDSVFSIDKAKEFASLESKRELEIKEKENLLLLKDNELFNSELLQKNQKISLAEKEKEIQHLAFLKEQSEKQEKEKQLILSEAQMQLQNSRIESLDKEKEKNNAEIRAKSLQRNFFIAGVIVFLCLFLIAFYRFREKKKLSEKLALQNTEIENQKSLVEEKNEQIYASITYASTIQSAILPWISTLKNAFSDILIFYKPKDIVSGDSYWFQEVDGIKFLAVIDCTGHGIPGAMLTVIASTALDDAVLGKRLSDTAQILTYMNEKVTEVLNQRLAENKIRDGMELALIAIHQEKVQFSGAGRPLYIKNGTMEIIKTDKRGIAGQTENDEYQFSSIEIEKSENLILYLSSDGYADQMNEQSKKYSTKRFVALLDSISEKPIYEQQEILENEFNSHKGTRSQIDDVTILGVKI